jgi:peptidoglycan-N-acetylglucosamine deacetylase
VSKRRLSTRRTRLALRTTGSPPSPGAASARQLERSRRALRRQRRRRAGLGLLLVLVAAAAAVAFEQVRAHGGSGAPAASAPTSFPLRREVAAAFAFPAGLVLPGPAALSVRAQRALDGLIRIGMPVYCGGGRGRYVALTFDDGPGPYTATALRILRHAHARATFFLVGRNLGRWPSLPRQERRLGSLGDHTWTHAWLTALPVAQAREQLARTQAAITVSSGAAVRVFRPPYGAHNHAIDRQAQALGMLQVLWSIDSRDSEGARWRQIAANVARNLHPGAIVLLHENHGQTIRALKYLILPMLHRRHYRTVTIPELLALDPPGPAQTHKHCA